MTRCVIAIAGTVGIGKSTLTQKLAERLNFKTNFEVVDSNPYLERYYEDFERWGFHLQIFFLAERFKSQMRMFNDCSGFVQDRTIYEDLEIFAKLNYDNKSMSEEDYQTYRELFEAMVYTPYFKGPDLVIYLEGSDEMMLDRINRRGREMEINTDDGYWFDLNRRYESWIEGFDQAPVLRLNICDYDVEDESSIDKIMVDIRSLIKLD